MPELNELTQTVRRLRKEGVSQREICERYDVTRDAVYRACAGKNIRTRADWRARGSRGMKKPRGVREDNEEIYSPCTQEELEAAETKPDNCTPVRWRVEQSRRRLAAAGDLDYFPPPDLLH